MSGGVDVSDIQTFGEARSRLEDIVTEVKEPGLSLEKSLDLFEEAIALANRCSDLIEDSSLEADAQAGAATDGRNGERGDAAAAETSSLQVDEGGGSVPAGGAS